LKSLYYDERSEKHHMKQDTSREANSDSTSRQSTAKQTHK